MKNFGSIEAISTATVEELEVVPQINHIAAVSIYEFFHGEK